LHTKAIYTSLEGRTVLVTGGASGIGAGIVRGFARNRSRVAFLDLDAERGGALAAELDALFLAADLTDVDALRVAVREAERQLGPIRALINNAGNDTRYELEQITPEIWDATLSVNLRQQFFTAQAVADGMKRAGGGAIVNLSSTAWLIGMPQLVPYTSAKAAVLGMTKSLGAALGEHDIRVNAIAPGAVMTQRQMDLWYTPETKAAVVQRQTIRRDLLEEDIADAALFLCADDSRMITKQMLVVDGGLR
jgi:NAD(P)-dependent dehydrogenase (short-subunit alcohol dehydrogenase family)